MTIKILKTIESHRNSKNILWQLCVFLKDIAWILFYKKIPNIRWNRKTWINYSWLENGDEWTDMAEFCQQPYPLWKQSIVDKFILPYITQESSVLEIAPGFGRWTAFLLKTKQLKLVDLNIRCINECKKKFSQYQHIEYFVNNGKDLSFIATDSIDFIWSFDSFVHMEKNIIRSYLQEFSRILKPNGKAIIHHHDQHNSPLSLVIDSLKGKPIKKRLNGDGGRSSVTRQDIEKIATKYELDIIFQVNSWGEQNKYNCMRSHDCITCIAQKSI